MHGKLIVGLTRIPVSLMLCLFFSQAAGSRRHVNAGRHQECHDRSAHKLHLERP